MIFLKPGENTWGCLGCQAGTWREDVDYVGAACRERGQGAKGLGNETANDRMVRMRRQAKLLPAGID